MNATYIRHFYILYGQSEKKNESEELKQRFNNINKFFLVPRYGVYINVVKLK